MKEMTHTRHKGPKESFSVPLFLFLLILVSFEKTLILAHLKL